MRFLVLGASGMAGHTISLYLLEKGHEVDVFSRRACTFGRALVGDAEDLSALSGTIRGGDYDFVINCIGALNQFAEADRARAAFLNAFLPHWLARETKETKTRVIHMSTDCVFSGAAGGYTENDVPDGRTFYDRSKALGELIDDRNLTFRNSIIGPDLHENGIGLLHWFMRQTGRVEGYRRAIWSGVTTLTLAKAMERAAREGLTGLYHLTNGQAISKYELLRLFRAHFHRPVEIVPVDGVAADKSLVCTRTDFSFVVPSYGEMARELCGWIKAHRGLYPHYFGAGETYEET